MPEWATPFKNAIEQLDIDIKQKWPGARRLERGAIIERFPNRVRLTASWHIVLPSPNSDALIISVDDRFPWSLPAIALSDRPCGITYPHVELDGQICVVRSDVVYELPVDIRHVEDLVDSAIKVLNDGRQGANDDEFFSETHSYWSLIAPAGGLFLVLSEPLTEHGLRMAASCGNHVLVADSAKTIKSWAEAAHCKVGTIGAALQLSLRRPLHPRDYPRSPAELIEFIDDEDATALLRSAVAKWNCRDPLRILISFPYQATLIMVGAELPTPSSILLPGAKHRGIPGFRNFPSNPASNLKALQTVHGNFCHWNAISVQRRSLRDRTAGETSASLETCHVLVLGCGALGGQLAVQLAQAGVGQLTLLDSDVLDWRNVGRHVLDGTYVGMNKALAVRESIRRRFPDIKVEAYPETWEHYYADNDKIFTAVDLIISATAEPASNLHLDYLSKRGDVAPVLFGWMEPFATCGHAIFRYPGGLGLSDVTDRCGLLVEPVIDISSVPHLPRDPSCGALYQPYSSLSALSCITLIGELAVDALLGRYSTSRIHTWIGNAETFQKNGLSITPSWHLRLSRSGYARRYDRPLVGRTR